MSERWAGIVVSGDKLTIVDAEVPDTGPLVVVMDGTWSLQDGDRSAAYAVMYQQIQNYVRENQLHRVVVKASAKASSMGLSHLRAAELRGVIQCAAAAIVRVDCEAKGVMSRTYGGRNVDQYLKDNAFWAKEIDGALRSGSREAAMILLATRRKA